MKSTGVLVGLVTAVVLVLGMVPIEVEAAVKIKIDAEKLVEGDRTKGDEQGCEGDLLKLKVKNPTGTDFTGLTGNGFFLNACVGPLAVIDLTVTGSSISGDTITLTCVAELEGVPVAATCEIRIDLDGPGSAVVVIPDFPVGGFQTSNFKSTLDLLELEMEVETN